jgi:CotH kinase protein
MFDPNTVVELDLGLSPAAIALLEDKPDKYQCGTFQMKVGGEVKGPPLEPVGIRLKGSNGSFREIYEKPGFKVKFDECDVGEDQTFFGLEKLTLNNMVQDPSMLHEVFSYDLFRAMGVPAPRTGYTFTRLNGEPIGVHANIETYDLISLAAWLPTTQHLYEADLFDVDVVPGGAGAFEVDEGDDEDTGDLEALIAAANDETGDWSDGMTAVADLVEMTRMWAVERYIGHWDGYAGGAEPADVRPNNYYLHSEDSGVFQMLPWGTDQTWDVHLGFDEPAGGLLFNECYADPSCKGGYDWAVASLPPIVDGREFADKVESLAELLAPYQALELESRREYSAEEIAEGVEETLEYVESRHIPLSEYIAENPPPSDPSEEPKTDPDPKPKLTGAPNAPSLEAVSTAEKPTLKFRRPILRGMSVVTQVAISRPGVAEQRVTLKRGKQRTLVCKARKSREVVSTFNLMCRLPVWTRRLREQEPLSLRVALSFTPHDGDPTYRIRNLTAPRLQIG